MGRGGGEAEVPEDGEDARTLPAEVDATGRHHWRSAVNCSSTCGHDTEDFEGLPSVLRPVKYFLQTGGDPRLWPQQWQYQKGLRDHDRTLHELREITEAFFCGVTVDQLNCAALLCFGMLGKCENCCVWWRYRHRCHCSLSYRRAPFESNGRKQLSLSSCGWVLIRSGQFKITLVAELGIQPIVTCVLDRDVGHRV